MKKTTCLINSKRNILYEIFFTKKGTTMTITSNFTPYPASYYAKNLLQNAKDTWFKACPLVSTGFSIGVTFCAVFPENFFTFLNSLDDEEDSVSTNTTLFLNQTTPREVAQFYLKNSVHINEELEGKEELVSQIEQHLASKISFYKKCVENLNSTLNTSAELCFQFPQEGEAYNPYAAMGGTLSITNPLILLGLLPTLTPTQAHVNAYQAAYSNALKGKLEAIPFVLTHEFIHVVYNDTLTRSACLLLTSVMSALPWVIGFSEPISWTTYLTSSLAKSYLIETVSAFAQDILKRYQERRADLQAVEYLDSSKSAEEFFLANKGEDYEHPPTEERLEYVRAFKPLLKRQAV